MLIQIYMPETQVMGDLQLGYFQDGITQKIRGKIMAITKEIVVDKIEVSESSIISVRTATVLKEDGIELNRSFHRHSVVPSVRDGDTWKDADISGEDAKVQAIANATWTDEVKKAYQDMMDAESGTGS